MLYYEYVCINQSLCLCYIRNLNNYLYSFSGVTVSITSDKNSKLASK